MLNAIISLIAAPGYNFAQRILTCFKYPTLRIGGRVSIKDVGVFRVGKGCIVSDGANFVIAKDAEVRLGSFCFIGRQVELGPKNFIDIGDNTSIQDRSILIGDVSIGQDCMLSLNVLISSGKHYYDLYPSWLIKDQDHYVLNNKKMQLTHSKPVIIEDDCWLGVNTVVMPGVTIGRGSVVGANSVVTHDVFPYSVVAGIPAKLIKKRLEFIPFNIIRFEVEDDRPYFYSGFNHSRESISTYHGMVINRNSFTICLDCNIGDEVLLSIKNAECTIMHGSQRRLINCYLIEVSFIVEEKKSCFITFNLLNIENNSHRLILLTAKIQKGSGA